LLGCYAISMDDLDSKKTLALRVSSLDLLATILH
jgi:hypothetical protein